MIIRDILLILLSCLLGIIMALIHVDKTDKENKIFAIKELEKIKAEIENIRLSEENVDSNWCAGLKYVNNKIIDNHIAELKGEQE